MLSEWMLATIAVAAIVASSLWMSVRVAAPVDLQVLPSPCRQRVEWWRAHTRPVYLSCATASAICAGMQLHQLVR